MKFAVSSHQSSLNGTSALAAAAICLLALSANRGFASTTVHTASAYGAKVNVGSTVTLGPIAPAVLSACSTQSVGSNTATAGSVSDPPLVNSGVVNTSASSTANSSTGVADVLGVNLLGGLITANEVKAVSASSVDGGGLYHFSSAGSSFTNLAVLGLPVAGNPAPNTVIQLPGIGSVILNQQSSAVSSNSSRLTVNMIHVYVTLANALGIQVGTEIVVSDAASQIQVVNGPAAVGGYALAPRLTVGAVRSGALVSVYIPCTGTNGAVETDSVASTSIPGVLTTGTVTVTGSGNVNPSETMSQATTSTAGVNLLSGLVTASAINGIATGVTTDGTNFTFTGGSTFTGLSVLGHPEITSTVAPNTRVTIANLGTLYLNTVKQFPNEIYVVPLQLYVTTANTLGLPIGAKLIIGAADAQLHSVSIP